MLHVHRAEGGRALVEGLAAVLAVPPGDPFAREVVAVPARGVERWITQQLSHVLGAGPGGDGVCALVDFPHPHALLDDVVAGAGPEQAAAVEAWAPERAVWALLEVLDACPADEPWCAGLRHHLGLDGASLSTRRYAVAARLTGLFQAYAAARPELLCAWAEGDDAGVPDDLAWQPRLWRLLADRLGPSPAQLLEAACEAVRRGAVELPERVSVYGPSRLDAARLRVLAAVAEVREVHLWLHVASPALWAGQRGRPPARRRAELPADLPRHPLLASLSRDVRELQLRLAAVAPGHHDEHHAPAPAQPTTLLQRLQADLRDDLVPGQPYRVAPADRSVQVHACHGRARQVEVLREVVLGLLADDPTLEPRDVLVLCPDVDAYAPLVAAAFGSDSHPSGRLRVALADRSPRQANALLGVAATLLELATSRVTSAQLLDLAGAEPVRRRFRLDDDALEQLRGWAAATGVRWGLDADGRAPWGMQGLHQGTWSAGLDRLLAGVAMDAGDALLGGTVPVDVDSSDADLAGRVAELVARVSAALQQLRGEQPAARWLEVLEQAVLQLTDVPPDGAWQLAQLRRVLGDVAQAAAGSSSPLTLTDAAGLLAERLAGRPTTTSFRTGSLTVCTLTPMRSVPHRVICLLGLDDGAFPRTGVPDGDDLLTRDPLLGERDPRSEDRALLLDAVMAAGEHLVATYSGADVRTGAPLPPAVPLGELLDALDATACTVDGRPVRAHVLRRHPLQPFDARCFAAAEPLSFDPAAFAGARSAVGPRTPAPPFLAADLGERTSDDDRDVALARLTEFLVHPAKGLLRQRLDVATSSREEEPADALPIDLRGLPEWSIGDRVLRARLTGATRARVQALELARGELPPGALGAGVLDTVGDRVEQLVAASAPHRAVEARTVDVEAVLGDRRLLGSVRGVRGRTCLTVTYSTVRAAQRLRAWVDLLALTASTGEQGRTAVVVGRAPGDSVAVVTLGPVSPGEAQERLVELLALRDAGLRGLLPLPVRTGEAYASARRRGQPASKAFWAARKEWASSWGYPREDADAEHLLVWGRAVPFDDLWGCEPVGPEPGQGWTGEPTAFGRLARRLWEPLLEVEQVRSA